jgi:prepilin-type N-terminal cleavage/methylation domain-containing protein
MVAMGKCYRYSGFTLIEVMIAIGIVAILMGVISVVSSSLSKSFVDVRGQSEVISYRTELKRKLRSNVDTAGAVKNTSQCLSLLGAGGLRALTPAQLDSILNQMVKDITSANTSIATQKQFQIPLPDTNLLSPDASGSNPFGDYRVTSTYLNSFVLFSEATGFEQDVPQLIDFTKGLPPVKTFITYLIQAELHAELSKVSSNPGADVFSMRPIRLDLAIHKNSDGSIELLDCGAKHLSEISAQFEICRSLGPDFKYVYDNFDGPGSGQCYAPMYDPGFQAPAFSDSDFSNGRTANITGYMPLKAFFCRFAVEGKGYDFAFCTGVN